MWTRMLFWKRKLNRIYTACPEIRHIIDDQSRNAIMNAVRLIITFPIVAPWGTVAVFCWMVGLLGGWMIRAPDPIFGWIYRPDHGKFTAKAHEILPAATIKERLNPNCDS